MLRIVKTLIMIAFLFLSACGYYLRGSNGLSDEFKKVYLQEASSQLKKNARRNLRSSDGVLVSSVDEAGLVIHVLKEEMDKRFLSLSSTGRASEYELTYKLIYSLNDAAGKQLAEAQEIEIIRDYFNDQEDILAKNKEEQVIINEMYRQAVQTIFRRARITLKNLK